MFLCVCKAVRLSEAVDAARSGVDTPALIRRYFGFDDAECCGRCAKHIESVAQLVRVKLGQVDQNGAVASAPLGT